MVVRCARMTEDIFNYQGKWITLSSDLQRVVGYGEDGRDAILMAREAGEEHAFLYFVQKEGTLYI